jgi:hypothetical protein
MLPRDTAADGGVRRIEQEDFHNRTSIYWFQSPRAVLTLYYKVYDAPTRHFVQIVIAISSELAQLHRGVGLNKGNHRDALAFDLASSMLFFAKCDAALPPQTMAKRMRLSRVKSDKRQTL